MSDMSTIIDELLKSHGITGAKMCSDLGMSKSFMTELRKGRSKSFKIETAQKIAEYLGVTVGYLLGKEETKKAPTGTGERKVSDEDIKFALFGGDGEITDAMFDEVKRFAEMVKLREDSKKKKE